MNLQLLEALMRAPAAELLGFGLALLKITCVLLAALAITVAMRRSSAGTRHLVWLVALSSLLVLPVLAAWAPMPVRVLPERIAMPSTVTTSPIDVAALEADLVGPPAPTSAATTSSAEATAPAPWRSIDPTTVLVGFWLLGVALLLARLVFSAWAIRRIVRGARRLDHADWVQPLYEIADRLGLAEAPRLLQSERTDIPFAYGFLKASIVLPADSQNWSAARRSAVLVHELGHVRRRDLIGHTVSRIVCALYWFHPLVWSAARRLRVESERACDDLALVMGARPSEYAEHLLDIVTHVRHHGAPAIALAMANPNEFEGRMLAILNPDVRRRGLGRVQAAWLVGSLTVIALLLGVLTPAPRAASKPPGPKPPTSESAVFAGDDGSSRSNESSDREVRSVLGTPDHLLADRSTPRAEEILDDEDGDSDSDSESESSDEAVNVNRLEVLARTLERDDDKDVRRVAAWGLAHHAKKDVAAEALAEALVSDEDEAVREMAAWGLSESQGGSDVTTALYAAFKRDKSSDVRRTAAWAAGSIGDRSAVPGLVGLLSDRDPALREVAAWSIGSCGAEHAPAGLVRALGDANRDVRLAAAWALREIGDPESADALEAAFRHEEDQDVRLGLIRALGSMGDRAVETLSRLVESSDPQVRAVAITALAGGNATGPWPWPRPEPRPFP